ncbi:MAG: formylglycine-generating enzyme family protein [Gammaproteobacteria bacterium]|nr:formylglycine-generating enzyme family protein [Gammaproteobacteria bacterium]
MLNDSAWHPLADGCPPAWASEWGQDQYGVWTAFRLEKVTQRLRWIPSGRFLMGSPASEPGRWDDEGPQHEITITEGFWLFDTPVTQALWGLVMADENPARFQSPNRPVEQVSWEDCRRFITQINERIPGLALTLPAEAQWEYACRAGTDTAVYAGPMEIAGEHNAPVLDAIAWYGGNSGVGFELENGEDSSDWPEKQYEHKQAGTHPVGQKKPNFWGLYDMLGNVWEWCEDGMRDYSEEAQINPLGSMDIGASRACRGGSWHVVARYVRAAFRIEYGPGYRYEDLGFRCARVQA